MLDYIHICVFLFFEKLFLSISTATWYLSTDCYLSSFSFFFSQYKLTQSQSIELSGLCLNCLSTNSQSIEKLSIWPIDPRQILDPSRLAFARQLLNLSRSSYMYCFLHVLHLSIILSCIASCFITFIHLYVFLLPPWSSLIILTFLEWSFLAT